MCLPVLLCERHFVQFQMHLDEERDKWESNKKHELSAQMEAMKTEMTSKSKQLREELDRERTLSASYLQQLKDLKQVLVTIFVGDLVKL